MKLRQTVLLILAIIGASGINTSAQPVTEDAIKTRLHGLIHAVQSGGYGEGNEEANEALEDYLLDAGRRYRQMLKWDLHGFDTTGLQILTSDDGKFRIYNWDQWSGGTMHFYSGVIQYEAAGGRTATVSLDDTASVEDGGNSGAWYTALRTVKTKSGKAVYIAFTHGSGSTIDKVSGIEAYTIAGGKLVQDYPFFHTKTRQFGHISYYYSLRETTDFDYNDFPEITLSKDNGTLTIPVVTEGGKVTKGKLTYKFDGEKFVFVKK